MVELGATCLSHEFGWHTLCCLRTHILKELSLTVIVRHLLKTFEPFGIGVNLPGVGALVVARVAIVLADEAALKSLFEFKGASGLLPCPLCSNVVLRSSDLHLMNPELKQHSVTSLDGCLQHTDASVGSIIRRLRSQKDILTKKKFADLEKSLGFNFVADGILDGELLGITALHFDWAHCVLLGVHSDTENAHIELTYTEFIFHAHTAFSRPFGVFHVHLVIFTFFTVFTVFTAVYVI